MVIANVLNTYTTASGLWQYDYGQILRIQNLKLPHAVEIHFSLQEKGGESVTRVGTTRDNVTDVVIPDSMLENGDTTADYKIYAFIYLTDSESGQAEYKISMSVKARPKPEQFEKPEDEKLFRQAIAAVNESATSAQESATRAETAKEESVAAAKKAKQSAEEASTSAQNAKNSADASKGSEKTASSAATEAVNAKDIAVKAADSAYNSALASSRSAKEAQTNAEQADTAAKSAAQSKQDIQELKTAIDSTAEQIATDRTTVETDKKEVQKAKSDVEDLKSAVEQKSSEALVDLENTEVVIKKNINDLKDVVIEKGNEAISGIETARDNAINDVNNAKDSAVNTIAQEKESAVNAVNDAKDNAVAEINKNENVQQIKQNKEDIAEAKTDIEELKDKKITKFYANSIGESYLQDSDNSKIQDMILYGRSEQKQYTGKNLANGVNNGLWLSSGATICGISNTDSGLFIDVSELSYVTVSTRNKQKRYRVGNINTLPTKENPNIDCYNGTQMDGQDKSYTLDTTGYKYLVVNATNLEDIQIEIGTEATEYEQYVGGIPSPNIEYPQEIKSVINPVVKIIGKNLLDVSKIINKTINGVEFTPKTDGALIANGTATNNVTYNIVTGFAIKAGTYAIKGCKAYYRTIDNKTGWFGTDKNTFTVATFDSDALLNILIFIPTGTTISETLKPMLIKGNTDGEFEKYKEQIINLPYTLNSIPVSKNGNVTINGQQYVSDYIDIERGKLVKCIAKEILNTKSGTIDEEYRLKINTKNRGKTGNLECLFSKFIFTYWETCVNKNNLYLKNIKKQNGDMYTAQELKEAEIEFTVLCQLEKQEEIDLTQEEIKAFKELATYYPVTNVSITSDQLDGYTTFNYPISMKNGWDYVKQQLGDTRDYIYDVDKKAQDIDTQSAEAYVNSEYAVALTELEVM
ncbi:hypothetical protein [Anaerostipes hadrus]|uniref:hypothetical protein n=1 Tax=Anaerostipes hadrus TaxID=649756 RepID=UPI001C016C9A|nr:hypothetical protein [Anaerostipes hadrus]MBT9939063.1 hypothetical protein [Anaerostipes hadrus]